MQSITLTFPPLIKIKKFFGDYPGVSLNFVSIFTVDITVPPVKCLGQGRPQGCRESYPPTVICRRFTFR